VAGLKEASGAMERVISDTEEEVVGGPHDAATVRAASCPFPETAIRPLPGAKACSQWKSGNRAREEFATDHLLSTSVASDNRSSVKGAKRRAREDAIEVGQTNRAWRA